MAQPLQLPIVTTTCLEISAGQEIGVQDVLRGLKRPCPKFAAAPAAHDILSLNATAALDHVVSVPFEPPPIGLFEEQNEVLMLPTPAGLYVRIERPTNEVMEAPKAVRTYTRKAKFLSPGTEKPRDPSPLFCSQGPLVVDEQLTGGLRHKSDARMDNPETYVVYPLKCRIPLSKASSNDDLLDLPVEKTRDKTSTSDIDITSEDNKRRTKANEKKRRVPVNELALVPSLPTHSNSSPAAEHNRPSITISCAGDEGQLKEALDDIDFALLGELDNPHDQVSSKVGQSQKSREADLKKLGTKFRNATNVPQRHGISHVGFRFPPATPKAVKTRGWKLGSGFEGTELESMVRLRATKACRPKARCVKYNQLQTPSIRSLELSTTISLSKHANTCRRLSNGGLPPTVFERSYTSRKDNVAMNPNMLRMHTLNAESGGVAVFDRARALATPMRAPIREINPKESVKMSATQTSCTTLNGIPISDERESENGQNIREPSKSEREGWLNRRGEVSFVMQAGRQGKRYPSQESHTHSVVHIFNAHNATWYGEARAKTQQTLPPRILSNHAVPTEQVSESHRSDKRRASDSVESEVRLGEEDEMLFDDLDTDHNCQTLRPSRSIAINIPKSCDTVPSRSNNPAFSSRFQVAKPSRTIEVQDSQERRRESLHMAVMEA